MLDEKKLVEIVEEALELRKGTISSGDKDWYSLWDSLGHLSILVKLDQVLDGKCSEIKELSKAVSIDSIKEVLKLNNLYWF